MTAQPAERRTDARQTMRLRSSMRLIGASLRRLIRAVMQSQFHQQLHVRLFLVTLLPIVLVSSVISVAFVQQRRDQVLEQAELRVQSAGQTAQALYTERLAFAALLADLLADRSALVQNVAIGNSGGVQDFVQQTRNETLFDLVTIVDADGAVIAQDGRTDLWRSPRAPFETLAFWGATDSGLIAQIMRPINQDGALKGHFIGSFVIGDSFLDTVRAQTNLDQSILFDDQLVATSKVGRMAHSTTFLQEVAATQILAHRAPTTVEARIGGTPYLAHYEMLYDTDLNSIATLEILLPLTPIVAAQERATNVLLVTTLLAVLLAMALSWWLAQRFTGSVRRLARAAQTMSRDLAQPVAIAGPIEIEQLSQSMETMRRQLHQALYAIQAEKARYAGIVESVEEAVITLDPNERVVSLNHSAEALLGIERAAAAGCTLGHIAPLRDADGLTLAHIPPTGAAPLAIRTRDGRCLTVAVTRSHMHEPHQGVPEEHILVLRDISAERAVSRLKEDFLANITHEFRTPLASLIASIEILREEDDALTATERRQMLTTLHVGVQRLDTLVQNLLDSASMQAGYFQVTPDVNQIQPLIVEAVAIMCPLMQQRRQTIRIDVPARLPPVLADDRRIIQALINLLSNAGKFGPQGDTIQVTATVEEHVVAVSVTDHGPGIAAHWQASVFERFLRPGADTTRAQGAGLGLAIVKAIIERHGGHISVTSSDEAGTTFTFTLPRASSTVTTT